MIKTPMLCVRRRECEGTASGFRADKRVGTRTIVCTGASLALGFSRRLLVGR